MRRPIIILLVVVAVIILAIVLAASLINVNKFRPRIQAELQTKLGRPVTLGELHLRLLPLSIRVDGLTMGQPAGWPAQPPFATAKEVYASASLFSLLRGQPHIKDLSLDQPQIELIKNPQGVWNFSNIGNASANQPGQAKSGANQPGQANTSAAQPQQPAGLTLNQLKITDGQVAITDQQAKAPRAVYNHIDLKVTGFSSGKPFDFDLAAHFPGQGKELLAFSGTAGPFDAGNTQIIPVTGHLSLQEVSVAGVNSVAPGTIPPNTDGILSGKGDVTSQNENVACKGNFKVENAVIHGAKLGYPIDAQYDLAMNRKTNQIQIQSGSVKLGPTAISISGAINSASKPSTLNLRVKTANASITDLSRLASTFSGSSGTADQIKGSVSANLAITGTLNTPQIQGDLSSGSIQAQGLVLNNVRAKCSTNNGVVTLSPVTAGIFGGQANGTIAVDTRPTPALCSVKTNLSGVDTNALLSAVSSLKNTLYGSLATDANLSFGLGSADDISKTLNGIVNFNVTNGQLKNINILKELSTVGKFLNPTSVATGNDTALKKFSGTLNIRNGLASTNNLVAVLNEGSLSANGSLNLVNQGLDLHMNAVLAKGISSAVGGNSIGGFLNTALANNQGELVLPVLVTGTTAHPVFTPDVQAIAKMKLNHLLPTSGDPSKMTNGLAGSVLNGLLGQQSGQQKNQKQQQSPLDSLFKQLGKKKH